METAILIHDAGVRGEDWHSPVIATIREAGSRYSWFSENDLEDEVRFVPVNYGDYLQAAVDRWRSASTPLSDFFAGQALIDRAVLPDVSVLGDAKDGVARYLLDLLVYRFFEMERANVIDQVIAQIVGAIADAKREDPGNTVSVLAHGLGAAVAHDAIAKLLVIEDVDGSPNPFRGGAGAFGFRALHFSCNLSQFLETSPGVYKSGVRPSPTRGSDSCCDAMYVYSHRYDPLARLRPVTPQDWDGFRSVEIDAVRDLDVHAWSHYLAAPEVHVQMFNTLLPSAVVSPMEYRAALQAEEDLIDTTVDRFLEVVRIPAQAAIQDGLATVLDLLRAQMGRRS